jgi:NAD(P)-dependent dehydrogenase (short-subunit alcohol dehydrogenase family)
VSRRVLVTGGASGLGAALVAAFRAAGDDVLVTDVDAAAGAADASGSVVDLALDVTSDADWAAALAHVEQSWGGLDILVNNAGIAGGGRIELSTIEEWQRIIDVNLLGVVRGTRTFTPMVKAQGSGQFVNVASLAGLVHAAGMGSYNAVKAAVVAFTETTGHELHPFGVNASVVCPSYFRTNLLSSMRGSDRRVGEVVAGMIERSTVTAEEVAAAVLEGIANGDDLIVPDEPARQAYALKWGDRPAYDALMRHQASRLAEGR